MALTPMVLTARLIKNKIPDCKVVFVGPCAAKKLEARRRTIRSNVDFVLTFEEFSAILDAKGIKISDCEDGEPFREGSGDGNGFAVSGGVAKAVENIIKEIDPDREVLTARAEGLPECRKMLQLAKAGKYDGYLLEGMGCPGGCVAGAGTIAPVKKTTEAVNKKVQSADVKTPLKSKYAEYLPLLVENEE